MVKYLASASEVEKLEEGEELLATLEGLGLIQIYDGKIYVCPDLERALGEVPSGLEQGEVYDEDTLYEVLDLADVGLDTEELVQLLSQRLGYDVLMAEQLVGVRFPDLQGLWQGCREANGEPADFTTAVSAILGSSLQNFLATSGATLGAAAVAEDSSSEEDGGDGSSYEWSDSEAEDSSSEEEVVPARKPGRPPKAATTAATAMPLALPIATAPALPLLPRPSAGLPTLPGATLSAVKEGVELAQPLNPQATFQGLTRAGALPTATFAPRTTSGPAMPTAVTTTNTARTGTTSELERGEIAKTIDPRRITTARVAGKKAEEFYSTEELKDYARRMGLPVSGSKAQLIDRLYIEMRKVGVPGVPAA